MTGKGWRSSMSMLLLLAAVAPGCGVVAQGQSSSSSSSSSSRSNSVPNPTPVTRPFGDEFPGMDPNFSHRQLVARREELKRRMVENANRLLALTRDLQAELETREPVEADGKRLDEIAKLARAVRDGMKQ